VLACGICGTDVRTFFNGDRRIEAPWVLGHEITGRILELGPEAPDAADLQVGDVVHCISTLYCGHCRLCRSGNEHICLNGELMRGDGLTFALPAWRRGSSADMTPLDRF
jgi:L-iditol 2-dehydrogenase